MNNTPAFPDWPESAFPSTFKSANPETGQIHRWGMSLRDYFAAKAMLPLMERSGGYWHDDKLKEYAVIAYAMADAMLKAREA